MLSEMLPHPKSDRLQNVIESSISNYKAVQTTDRLLFLCERLREIEYILNKLDEPNLTFGDVCGTSGVMAPESIIRFTMPGFGNFNWMFTESLRGVLRHYQREITKAMENPLGKTDEAFAKEFMYPGETLFSKFKVPEIQQEEAQTAPPSANDQTKSEKTTGLKLDTKLASKKLECLANAANSTFNKFVNISEIENPISMFPFRRSVLDGFLQNVNKDTEQIRDSFYEIDAKSGITNKEIYDLVRKERIRQHQKFGKQDYPFLADSVRITRDQIFIAEKDKTLTKAKELAVSEHYAIPTEQILKKRVENFTKSGELSYADIILEEFSEALNAPTATKAIEELVHCAASIFQAIQSLKRNGR